MVYIYGMPVNVKFYILGIEYECTRIITKIKRGC